MAMSRFQNYEAVAALQHTPDYFRTTPECIKNAADTALRAWFEDWLIIPVCHFFYMPMTGYLQLMDATVILLRRCRLTLLARYRLGDSHLPETDTSHNGASSMNVDVDSSSDDLMLNLLDRLASRFEEARIEMAAAHCSEWANDFLNLVAWKLRERKACIEKWIKVIANEAHINALRGAEAEAGHKLGDSGWDEGGDTTAFQSMEEPAPLLDSFEEFLMDDDAFESWL